MLLLEWSMFSLVTNVVKRSKDYNQRKRLKPKAILYPRCMYNTAVIYDNIGKLVAKYHKWNLFTTEMTFFNIDATPQSVFIDTDFGKDCNMFMP